MLLPLERLDGKTVFIDSSVIFRVRPGLKSMEPEAVSVVHYDPTPDTRRYETLASKEPLATVIAGLRVALPMVELTSPSGTQVFLDASKVSSIEPATKGLHFKGAKAVVRVYNQIQQVSESVAAARKLIDAARAEAAAGA